MYYVECLILFALLTVIFGFINRNALSPRKYLRYSALSGLVLIPVVGLAQGSFYSHGFDIPWWIFGVVAFLTVFLTALIVTGVANLIVRLGLSAGLSKGSDAGSEP